MRLLRLFNVPVWTCQSRHALVSAMKHTAQQHLQMRRGDDGQARHARAFVDFFERTFNA
jgi:hypothetical protein